MLSIDRKIKLEHMTELAGYRDSVLRKSPRLKYLFIEITNICNEHCLHCGSSCEGKPASDILSGDEIKAFLKKTSEQFDVKSLLLCITGGEPLLREDFFDIMAYAKSLGFNWGMTSNGTLIDAEKAHLLYETGMKTISVSLDGLRESNDAFRQKKGGFDAALNGVRELVKHGGFHHIQVTTVVHKQNIDELPRLYKLLKNEGLTSWRVINIEPIGRAKEHPELLLDEKDYKKMFAFIKKHFNDKTLPVTYGCSHYLGTDYEREVRKWYFLCNAGVYNASITYNGDIFACLDIARRKELIQGNIRQDDFADVWKNRFEIFRTDSRKQGSCADCRDYIFCAGGAFHTWNFDENRQDVCFKNMLFR